MSTKTRRLPCEAYREMRRRYGGALPRPDARAEVGA